MSSVMLHGRKHCNVEQVIPIDSFGSLTVLHLPNKNYRRVGRYRNRTFSDGTEHFEVSSGLLTEMRFHIELRNATDQQPHLPRQHDISLTLSKGSSATCPCPSV